MRNQYSGPCHDGCGTMVAAGEGYFHKMPRGSARKWVVRCVPCVAKGKQARGAPLSFAQQDALNPKCQEHGWRLPCRTCAPSPIPNQEGGGA